MKPEEQFQLICHVIKNTSDCTVRFLKTCKGIPQSHLLERSLKRPCSHQKGETGTGCERLTHGRSLTPTALGPRTSPRGSTAQTGPRSLRSSAGSPGDLGGTGGSTHRRREHQVTRAHASGRSCPRREALPPQGTPGQGWRETCSGVPRGRCSGIGRWRPGRLPASYKARDTATQPSGQTWAVLRPRAAMGTIPVKGQGEPAWRAPGGPRPARHALCGFGSRCSQRGRESQHLGGQVSCAKNYKIARPAWLSH